jgi:hypothetical protein
VFPENEGVKRMTELNPEPADRHHVQHDRPAATVTARTLDLEKPSYATTDIDPTPGSPRPLVAAEPSYATTDVDPTPGSPRPLVAAEPSYATTDVDPTPGRGWPDDVQDPSGGAAAYPAVDASGPDITPGGGR